ncbi:MAG: 4Fe-4S binding protein [Clostridiaceae bacterium]|nr:4Fe-4S binding protein [Clostridiaceae bacterium]
MKYIINIIRIVFLALFLFLLAKGKVMLWLALFGVSLVVALIFGRVYCGYICPMNTVMLPAAWLSKKLNLQTTKTPKWLKNGYFTWITFGVSIVVMLLSKRLLHINLPILPFWLAVSVLVTLRYNPEVFHNLICPFGALQKIFGRFARLSEKVDKDACIGCKLCEKDCPSHAIVVSLEDKKADINTALCFQCTNCQQVCPQNAIHYGKNV